MKQSSEDERKREDWEQAAATGNAYALLASLAASEDYDAGALGRRRRAPRWVGRVGCSPAALGRAAHEQLASPSASGPATEERWSRCARTSERLIARSPTAHLAPIETIAGTAGSRRSPEPVRFSRSCRRDVTHASRPSGSAPPAEARAGALAGTQFCPRAPPALASRELPLRTPAASRSAAASRRRYSGARCRARRARSGAASSTARRAGARRRRRAAARPAPRAPPSTRRCGRGTSTRRRTGRRSRRRRARPRAPVLVPDLDRVRPAERVQPLVGGADRGRDPAARTARDPRSPRSTAPNAASAVTREAARRAAQRARRPEVARAARPRAGRG